MTIDPKKQHVSLAVVCASNQNRSMEAHFLLGKSGFNVKSYGTGDKVKLPGPSIDKPNVYSFGTPYDQIIADLSHKDTRLYTNNGVIKMLERNRSVKLAPERFRDSPVHHDVIICCEERCFDQVIEVLSERGGNDGKPVHVINLDIRDNHSDAAAGARHILTLAHQITEAEDLEQDIEPILEDFEQRTTLSCLHSVAFY